MPHILFVCTANICRSPVAEGILHRRINELGITGWTVSSAGTWAIWDRGPARHSIQIMAEQGIDISKNMAEMITAEGLAQADLVLCMEEGHVEALRAEFPQAAQKLFLLSEMNHRRYNIPDPFGQDLYAHRQMANEVTALIRDGWPRIVSLAEENARARLA